MPPRPSSPSTSTPEAPEYGTFTTTPYQILKLMGLNTSG
ncbi:replication initiator protein A [Meiothermus hypogaeus]|nr:replication initiator protein A [Meiothermus hypogaeus]